MCRVILLLCGSYFIVAKYDNVEPDALVYFASSSHKSLMVRNVVYIL